MSKQELKTRTSVISCALVKITDGHVGHSILTSRRNLARRPGLKKDKKR